MPSHSQEASYSPARITLIVISLAMGGFGIGTGEFAIMGLMPGVAQDLGVSEPQVGHLISAYALGVVVGAPLLAISGARLYRRHLLIMLMGFYAAGNIASAMLAGQSLPQGVTPLRDVHAALNTRTASHLGIILDPRMQRAFETTFPAA